MVIAAATPVRAEDKCAAPQPVCAVRSAVFGISSAFDPYGSAVRIGADLLVTNRHAVVDETSVKVILPDGSKLPGSVVPTSFEADLILIRADLPEGPVLTPAEAEDGKLYAVGIDLSNWLVRVYPEGKLLRPADPAKPLARVHHTAYSQPGVSGGALVSETGAFVGIVTSGGAGRFEAIPAARLTELQKKSGDEFAAQSAERGKAYRSCIILLEKSRRSADALPGNIAALVESNCIASGNRQLFDMAGQVLGRSRKFDDSIALFKRSLEADPNAINARIGMVVILNFARRHKESVPHILWLLDVVPEDAGVARYALQAGKQIGDKQLAERGLALIKKHAPEQLEAAKRFYESTGSPPRRRP